MLTEEAILAINDALYVSGSYMLTQSEIDYLNQIGDSPTDQCGYYSSAQTILERRAKTDTTQNESLEALVGFATEAGCSLTLAPEVVPEVDIPVFGGSI